MPVAVACQLLHHADPEDALLGGVMKDVDPGEGQEHVSNHSGHL